MLKLLLITTATTALDHYARTVPAVVDRVRAAQVTADACETFAPCAAPVLADAADADAALASLRTHGYAIVESPGLAERWLEGARALTADDQLRGVWGSTAVAGRPDTLYGGYGGRTAVYVDIRWDERGRTLPRDCGAAAPALEGCVAAERLATRLLDAARVPRGVVDGPGAARPGRRDVSSASLRLCRYAPETGDDAGEAPWSTCRPHADAAWLALAPVGAVPGLAFYDAARGAWVEPERGREAVPKHRADLDAIDATVYLHTGARGRCSSGPGSCSRRTTPRTRRPCTWCAARTASASRRRCCCEALRTPLTCGRSGRPSRPTTPLPRGRACSRTGSSCPKYLPC